MGKVGTGPEAFGWWDNPFWGQTFVWLIGMIVVARLLTVGFLNGSQHGHRFRLVSRERRKQIRARFAQDASQRQYALRQLGTNYPSHWFSSVLDPLLGVLVVGGLTFALHVATTRHFTTAKDLLTLHQLTHSPPWPTTFVLSAISGNDSGGVPAVLLGAGLALAWLGVWFRTRYLMLCSQMPSGTWEHSALRRYLVPQLVLRFAAVLLVLPIAGLVSLLVWQAAALLRAHALHRATPVRTPPPVLGQPMVSEVPAGAVRGTWDTLSSSATAKAQAIRDAHAAKTVDAASEAAQAQARERAAAEAKAAQEARDAEIARQISKQAEELREAREAQLAEQAEAARQAAEQAAEQAERERIAEEARRLQEQREAQAASDPDSDSGSGSGSGSASAAAPSVPPAAGVTAAATAFATRPATARDPRAAAPTASSDRTDPAAPVPVIPCQPLHPDERRTIGSYQLLGRIGAGGFGTVYLARRHGSATQLALKTLHSEGLDDPDLLNRFEREGRILALVPGAHTARVLDTGLADGIPYIAMELLDGRPLDRYLREEGTFRSAEALRSLGLALAVALDGVHKAKLVHRDLKPANIMMTTAGPKLLDFGIAMMVDRTRLTRAGGGPGTLPYMAPEQVRDEPIGPAADIWAWGCCVVCAAHGVSPFSADTPIGVYPKILDSGPDPVALAAVRALDPALAAVVALALTKDVARRPADGAALLDLLAPNSGHADRPTGLFDDQITRGWQTLRL